VASLPLLTFLTGCGIVPFGLFQFLTATLYAPIGLLNGLPGSHLLAIFILWCVECGCHVGGMHCP
jgi:hypothetical protein